jgi:hypothetical protein
MTRPHHITVSGSPLCDYLGCQAGRELVEGLHVRCGHLTKASALLHAALIRPRFREGAVAVVAGVCPAMVASLEAS